MRVIIIFFQTSFLCHPFAISEPQSSCSFESLTDEAIVVRHNVVYFFTRIVIIWSIVATQQTEIFMSKKKKGEKKNFHSNNQSNLILMIQLFFHFSLATWTSSFPRALSAVVGKNKKRNINFGPKTLRRCDKRVVIIVFNLHLEGASRALRQCPSRRTHRTQSNFA